MAELIEGKVKIELECIGEGYDGDYDATNPDDIELMRFTVLFRDGEEWCEVRDASYCTLLPEYISQERQEKALRLLMDEFRSPVESGIGVSKLAEKMSWLCLTDLQ